MINGEKSYKEIYRQGQSISAINRSLKEVFEVLDSVFTDVVYNEIICIGCGTSYYLAQSVAFAFSSYTGIASKAVPCSEIYYYPEKFAFEGKNILVVPFTRSSKTTEVIKAVNKIRSYKGVKTLSVTCDPDSKNYNDYMIYSPDADEESIVMTSSYTSMLYLGIIAALYAANKIESINKMAHELSEQMQKVIKGFDILAKTIASEHEKFDLYVLLGQGALYGVANESMNKIKEMAIEKTEAYYTLEYRHGPMSIVDDKSLIAVFTTAKTWHEDYIFVKQMKTYGATVAVVSINCNAMDNADYSFSITNGLDDIQNTIMASVFGQLIGYHIACHKGVDADRPRHLAKAIILDNDER